MKTNAELAAAVVECLVKGEAAIQAEYVVGADERASLRQEFGGAEDALAELVRRAGEEHGYTADLSDAAKATAPYRDVRGPFTPYWSFTGPNVAISCDVDWNLQQEAYVATSSTGFKAAAGSDVGAALACFEAWMTGRRGWYDPEGKLA